MSGEHCYLIAFNSTRKWSAPLKREKGFKIVRTWAEKIDHVRVETAICVMSALLSFRYAHFPKFENEVLGLPHQRRRRFPLQFLDGCPAGENQARCPEEGQTAEKPGNERGIDKEMNSCTTCFFSYILLVLFLSPCFFFLSLSLLRSVQLRTWRQKMLSGMYCQFWRFSRSARLEKGNKTTVIF